MAKTKPPEIHRGLIGVTLGTSSLCSIDGEKGKLFYRNFPIEKLAANCSFEQVVWLLLHGTLPSKAELTKLQESLTQYRILPASIHGLLGECRRLPPTDALHVCLSALEDCAFDNLPEYDQALYLIGAVGSIIVGHYAQLQGSVALDPDPELDHASDIYRRLINHDPDPLQRKLVNLDFILHAEHGANASTTAMRAAASAGASLCGATSAALAALKGARHGGAPGAIFELIDGLSDVDQARSLVRDCLLSNKPIPGFGHRVYKTMDPRASLYRAGVESWVESSQAPKPTALSMVDAMAEEMTAYRRMGIWPNDDLLAVSLYSVLDIPKDLCVPLFAASRIVGWIAHYFEARNETLDGPLLYYDGRLKGGND